MDLKPCPFCGGEAIKVTKPLGITSLPAIRCGDEGCSGNSLVANNSYESAARDWNYRPIEDELRAKIEVLQAHIEELSKR